MESPTLKQPRQLWKESTAKLKIIRHPLPIETQHDEDGGPSLRANMRVLRGHEKMALEDAKDHGSWFGSG
jgi:hypothetical protein